MKMFRLFLCMAVGILASSRAVNAHPYASGVKVTGATNVTYHLNEAVTNGVVAYLFDNGSVSNYIGGTSTNMVTNGLQSFSMAGHTNFQIYIFNIGIGVPYQIDPNVPAESQGPNPHGTNVLVNFYGPRGVGVNRNPASPYFGTIYIAQNSSGSTGTGGRTTSYGIYALNADFSDAFGYGANAMPVTGTNAGQMRYGGSTTYSPYRVFVNKDDTLYVSDAGGIAGGNNVGGGVWMVTPTLTVGTDLFGFVGATATVPVCAGAAIAEGSYSNGTLNLYTMEYNRSPYQAIWLYPFYTNNQPLPLPWNQTNMQPFSLPTANNCAINNPNGIVVSDFPGIDGVIADLWIAPDGKFFITSERANTSDTSLWVFDNPTNGSCILFNSSATATSLGITAGTQGIGDPFYYNYSVAVSDDDQFVANGTSSANAAYGGPGGYIDICNLGTVNGVSGLPVEGTFYAIPYNTVVGCTVRGVGFDKADNVYGVSGSDDSLRVFSLGLTTTCVTGNDMTGTNGTFSLLLPPIQASVMATTPIASQNYGTPTPGVFTITLNTNSLTVPLTVKYSLSGTATNIVNYTAAPSTNSITIPAQTLGAGTNITANVTITPTANPQTGPTLTVVLKLVAGSTYLTGVPLSDTVYIANTGPQLLSITSVPATTMYRGTVNDYVEYVITRLGDTNAASYTITNFTFGGTAVTNVDYLAGPQNFANVGNLMTGFPGGVTFNPGDVLETNIVGLPVPTPYGSPPVGPKTLIIGLGSGTQTNQSGGTYSVTTNTTGTMTILDNAYKPEVVLWSDPLTNAASSTNWTLTFASTNLGATTQLPTLLSNYGNIGPTGGISNPDTGGTTDFDVEFGYNIGNDGIGLSQAMMSNNWSTALKMTVNKDGHYQSSAGVNVFPQAPSFQSFNGNFALRFSMNLAEALGNPIEYASFGIDTKGTNCDWIIQDKMSYGSGYTNQDGIFYLVAADQGAALIRGGYPDYACQLGTNLPNNISSFQTLSVNGAITEPGVFKHPSPYSATGMGTPANAEFQNENTWSDVEVAQSNSVVTMSINKTAIFVLTNTAAGSTGGVFTNGTIMLGYDDVYADNGQPNPAVYYSNVRVVELSPLITNAPVSQTVGVGSNATFIVGAVGVAPFTNTWYFGTNVVKTDTSATNLYNDGDSLVVAVSTNTAGTYSVVVSDSSGSVTSVFTLTAGFGPTVTIVPSSITTNEDVNISFTTTVTGTAPFTYQWLFNGTNLTNGASSPLLGTNVGVGGATTNALLLTNIQPADAGSFSILVYNAYGSGVASNSATLTVIIPTSPTITSVSLSNSIIALQFTSPDIYDTTNSFKLLSSTNLATAFTNTTATFTTNGSGGFRVTATATGAVEFYELEHK